MTRSLVRAFLVLFGLASIARSESPADTNWAAFRAHVPGHYQDWIVAGEGPAYTLIYSEPAPAFTLDEYGDVAQSIFRGYVSHSAPSRTLGYNGRVSDLVVRLDYGFAPESHADELSRDLANFSRTIYGTAYGARPTKLSTLLSAPRTFRAPPSISVGAAELNGWLFDDADPVRFYAPEFGTLGTFRELLSEGPAGRYLSSDESLTVLLIQRGRDHGVTPELLPHIRSFAIDSDFILGGIEQKNGSYVALVGRARQVPLIDFPALRVEDIVNALTSRDADWGQSYDRGTLGAGPAALQDGSWGDWAPSFLSAELINTEFGSLLNYADALLKSQSLSDTVRYRGYALIGFVDPPYEVGVFEHLAESADLSSLSFNFNTVGVGHWLLSDEKCQTYALNATGSFSVTYSPNRNWSRLGWEQAAAVAKAEAVYTAWFRKQRSYELVRTVQYMAIYQAFQARDIGGERLHVSGEEKFDALGDQLRRSVRLGAEAALERLSGDEQEKLAQLDSSRKNLAGEAIAQVLPSMPASLEDLASDLGTHAAAPRYNPNVLGAGVDGYLAEAFTRDAGITFRAGVHRELCSAFEQSERAAEQYSISTPSIVVSVDTKRGMTGGHTVRVERFVVELDESVPEGSFRLGGNVLRVNPTYGSRLPELTSRMAKVAHAGHAAQQKVLKALSPPPPQRTIASALDLAPDTDHQIESASWDSVSTSRPDTLRSVASVTFGRDSSSGRLFAERRDRTGQAQRTALLGSTNSPELIDGLASTDGNAAVMEVSLDRSLSRSDVDTIVANYKHAGGSGRGGGPPISRWRKGAIPEPQGPRMVIFREAGGGLRQRAIVVTDRGRVEVLVPRDVPNQEVLAALKTEIEAGARLTVTSPTSAKSGSGARLASLNFEFAQRKPIGGSVLALSRSKEGLFKRVPEYLKGKLRQAFNGLSEDRRSTADFMIEFRIRSEGERPALKIHWRIEREGKILRFTLHEGLFESTTEESSTRQVPTSKAG